MNLVNTFATWYQRRKAIAELSALSDTTLADIGIERGQIATIVDGLQISKAATVTRERVAPAINADVALSGT